MATMPTMLDRYDAGARQEVWDELHSFGSLRQHPQAVLRDVEAVARRTMERAATNLEMLARRLAERGFRFEDPDMAFARASPDRRNSLNFLVERIGPVPPALRALLETIGNISFRGWLPSMGTKAMWESQLLDPFEFCVEIEEDVEDAETPELRSNFRLCVAGDYLHKNDISGGAPTAALLPSDEADARIIEDDGDLFASGRAPLVSPGAKEYAEPPPERPIWLVDYLRLYFQAGGFRKVAGTESYPLEITRELARDLLDI